MRILAIDFGERRIGLASYDTELPVVVPKKPLVLDGAQDAIPILVTLADQEAVACFVVGLPLNMDGTEGDAVARVRRFGEALRDATGLNVEYVDERLTSRAASSHLSKSVRRRRDGHLDSLAAKLILEDYVENLTV